MVQIVLSGQAPLLDEVPAVRGLDTLDLRELTWATPFDAAVTACLYRLAESRGRKVRVLLPRDKRVRRYLVDLGVNEHVRGRWGPAGGSQIHPPLVPLTRLDGPEEWDDLLPGLWPHVRHELGDSRVADSLFDILGELVDNATTHGESEVGTFLCAQQYTGMTSGLEPGIWIGVADAGVGIPDHLRRRRRYVDIDEDEDLIRLARQPWVTGTSDRRGWGLVEVFREAAAVGLSQVIIRSGRGEGRFRLTEGRPPWARYDRLERRVAGTWVHLQLRIPSKG